MKNKEQFIAGLAQTLGSDRLAELAYIFVEQWMADEGRLRRECQKEGIKKARKKGVSFGRPKIQEPENFTKICEQYIKGEITAVSGAELCRMGISTFYRRVRDYRDRKLMEEQGLALKI